STIPQPAGNLKRHHGDFYKRRSRLSQAAMKAPPEEHQERCPCKHSQTQFFEKRLIAHSKHTPERKNKKRGKHRRDVKRPKPERNDPKLAVRKPKCPQRHTQERSHPPAKPECFKIERKLHHRKDSVPHNQMPGNSICTITLGFAFHG